jgi:glycosyltransferase involved in cell wall biosynthesis
LKPKVSVLLSVYNGQEHLAEALESVQAQSMPHWELIAVDDGSSDDSARILEAFAADDARMRVLTNPENLGLAASLNRGLRECRGEFVARQDADDISYPARLELQTKYLEEHPRVLLCGSAVEQIGPSGRLLNKVIPQPASDQVIRLKMLLTNAFHHSSVMLRLEDMRTWGLSYRTDYRFGQDYELWSRLLKKGQGGNLLDPLIKFRVHSGQVSKIHWRTQQGYADQVSQALFKDRGWDAHFSAEEIYWVRRSGYLMPEQTPEQRIMQLRCLLRFFALARAELDLPDSSFKMMRSQYFSDLRHCARHWPRDAATFYVLSRQALADPGGAVKEGLAFIKGLISGNLAPVQK